MRRQVVFNPAFTSWGASVWRGIHTDDQLGKTLLLDGSLDVVIAEPPRSSIARYAERLKARNHQSPPFQVAIGTHASICRPGRIRRFDPLTVKRAQRGAQRWSQQVGRHLRDIGWQRPPLILCNPFLAGLAEFPWAGSVTYLAADDYASGDYMRAWRPLMEHAYREIARRGMPVVAVTPLILDRIRTHGPTLVLPNAVDATVWLPDHPPHRVVKGLPRPLAIYVGTLDGRISRAALRQISRAVGQGSVLLVGRETNSSTREAAAQLPNVRFMGAVRPTDVPSLLAGADLALVPHVDSEVTRTMSPLKVYEYLAAGLPVVATDLEPMRGIDPRVILVDRQRDFLPAVTQGLEMARASDMTRRRFVAANSWERRSEDLMRFVAQVPGSHSPSGM